MRHVEITYRSPADAYVTQFVPRRIRGVNMTPGVQGIRTVLLTHSVNYVHVVLHFLRVNLTLTSLTLSQAWDRLPTESTAFWRLLDREPYATPTRKFILPCLTELHLHELHPKFAITFLRACELPQLTTLDIGYDTDITDSRPDRSELLRQLIEVAQPLLARLTTFRLSFDMRCSDRTTLAELYNSLSNVTCFSLHYWDAEFGCEEWWDVLRQQWEWVAACQANGYLGVRPYLPRLRRLHVSGFSIPTLRNVLALRRLIGYPVREVEYQPGYILQSEHDALQRELDVFLCFERITPDPPL